MSARPALPDGHGRAHLDSRSERHARLLRRPARRPRSRIDADGWVDTGDLGVRYEGACTSPGRSKEIIFINGQNYYPYDLENIAQRAPGLDLNKVVAAGVAKPGSQRRGTGGVRPASRQHRRSSCPRPPPSAGSSMNTPALEVAQVIPVKRIPKTTSGKVQRHLLERRTSTANSTPNLASLQTLRESRRRSHVTRQRNWRHDLQSICEAALPGKRIDVNDNLFEIGASSLKLIEIHENIDREFPGSHRLDRACSIIRPSPTWRSTWKPR